MRRLLSSFVAAESGATAIEYSIIAAGIALVIIATVNSIGTSLIPTFTSVQTALK
jgi:pilus assembly protein Flp/PilA